MKCGLLGEKLSQAGRLRELLLAKGLAPAEDEEYEKAVAIE